MARCPFATWTPVALRSSQEKIRPAGLVCHTAVSNSSLLKPSGEIRWHFYNNREGKLYQFFDTEVSAACQRDGNYWTENGVGWGFISCESWDGAGVVWDGENVAKLPAWNDAQMETWARLGAWLHEEHGVELVKATSARGKGIGFHAQFTNTSPYKWNTSHACPGPKRIAQMPAMIAAMRAAANAPEEDMPITDADAQKIAKATWEYRLNPGAFADRIGGYEPDATYPAGGLLVGGDAYGRELHNTLPTILAGIAKLGEQGLSDAERAELAADIAAQVNQWRVVLERTDAAMSSGAAVASAEVEES